MNIREGDCWLNEAVARAQAREDDSAFLIEFVELVAWNEFGKANNLSYEAVLNLKRNYYGRPPASAMDKVANARLNILAFSMCFGLAFSLLGYFIDFHWNILTLLMSEIVPIAIMLCVILWGLEALAKWLTGFETSKMQLLTSDLS